MKVLILLILLICLLYLKNYKYLNENFSRNIYLFTQYYEPKNLERKEEIDFCLQSNINNNLINKIFLFGEKQYDFSKFKNFDKKVIFINIEERLSFREVFNFANKKYKEDNLNNIFILSNSDIHFDSSLKNLLNYNLDNKFLCLSRIDKEENNKYIYCPETKYSQDTWIWNKEIKLNKKKTKKFKHFNDDGIKLGVMGCDNYMAYMMNDLGYQVLNSCKLINTFHKHKNDFREWRGKGKIDYGKEFSMFIKCT